MAVDRLGGKKTLKVGGFLEEFEKEALKRRVDLVELFGHFGVKLSKKGKSYTGRCPWHADKNPSLSVDRDQGLYHCFGCGESGDGFGLVEKMKGVGFAEALAFLKEWAGESGRSPSRTLPAKKEKTSPASTPSQETTPAALTLEAIAAYYHKRLYGSREAAAYLEKRGLRQGELLKRFGIGFADGSLVSKVSNGQKEGLKSLGVLRDNGREHLHACITVPLQDAAGGTVGFYGRKIKAGGSLKHLYLKGPHRGVFNPRAGKVYKEVVLTESILDALSLIALGIQNVQALYGTHGLTEEHLELLKADRVKTVVVALDADEAGRKAAAALAERLVVEGFGVKRIEPPEGKDWNEALPAGVDKETIDRLIAEAPVSLPPQDAAGGLTVERRGPQYLASSGGIQYRLLGVKPLFVASLRVNIRAEKEGLTFLDNVDLYSARSRGAFSAACAHLLGVEAARVEQDLLALVEYLEAERDRALEVRGQAGPRELTEEERALGLELLQSPELFDRIVADLETLGYVGEEVNKQLMYLAASSRLMEDPISVLILSQSAAGKSLLVDTVRHLMPEEAVVSVSSLSDQALNYLPEGGLMHKFLILGEAVHSEVVEHQIREMLSAHELSRLVTVKDPKTGELSARTVKSPVVVSAVMSSTRYRINPENASRSFVIHADESKEQTRRIQARQREKYSLVHHHLRRERIPRIIAAHQAAQRLLTPRLMVNPYAQHVRFPDTVMRTRRDHERFVDLIAAVGFLRQYRKEEQVSEGAEEPVRYLSCDLEDYRIAYGIVRGILPATVTEVPQGALVLYEELRHLVRAKGLQEGLAAEQIRFSQREVRERTGYGQMFVKRYLRVLVEWEYVLREGVGGRGSRSRYRVPADTPIRLLDLSMIPTPEQMEAMVSNG